MVEQESTREEGWSMAQGIWSTDSVADSRTGTDVRFGWGPCLPRAGRQADGSRLGGDDGSGG